MSPVGLCRLPVGVTNAVDRCRLLLVPPLIVPLLLLLLVPAKQGADPWATSTSSRNVLHYAALGSNHGCVAAVMDGLSPDMVVKGDLRCGGANTSGAGADVHTGVRVFVVARIDISGAGVKLCVCVCVGVGVGVQVCA